MKIAILLLILLIPLTTALEFYPTTLEFTLQPNEISCKKIYFELDSPATARDIWALNEEQPWSITNFQTPPTAHKLTLAYQK